MSENVSTAKRYAFWPNGSLPTSPLTKFFMIRKFESPMLPEESRMNRMSAPGVSQATGIEFTSLMNFWAVPRPGPYRAVQTIPTHWKQLCMHMRMFLLYQECLGIGLRKDSFRKYSSRKSRADRSGDRNQIEQRPKTKQRKAKVLIVCLLLQRTSFFLSRYVFLFN